MHAMRTYFAIFKFRCQQLRIWNYKFIWNSIKQCSSYLIKVHLQLLMFAFLMEISLHFLSITTTSRQTRRRISTYLCKYYLVDWETVMLRSDGVNHVLIMTTRDLITFHFKLSHFFRLKWSFRNQKCVNTFEICFRSSEIQFKHL